jgi:hypothetical protein
MAMRKLRLFTAAVICLLAPLGSPISARVDPADTRLLTQPAISASHVAFIYAAISSSPTAGRRTSRG